MNSPHLLDYWDKLVEIDRNSTVIIRPNGDNISRQEIDTKAYELENKLQDLLIPKRRVAILHTSNSEEWLINLICCLRAEMLIIPVDWNLKKEEAYSIGEKLGASVYLDSNSIEKITRGSRRRILNTSLILGKLTSGSTGTPKCIYFTSDQLTADGQRIIDSMGLRPNDINMGAIPWGHSYGIGNIVIPLFIQGTATTWSESPFPHDIAKTIKRTQSTVFPAVPTLLKAFTASEIDLEDLKSLRLVISAGSRLKPEIAQSFKQQTRLSPHNFYGSTETGGICYDRTGQDSLTGKSIGKPMPSVRLISLPKNRFVVSSSSVFTHGNRRNKQENLGSFLMVDSGTITEDGAVVLGNRVKGFAKIAGKRINLGEIEYALKMINGVTEALVFEDNSGPEPKLVAALQSSLDEAHIREGMKQVIPRRIMRPKKISCVKEFPTTPRGKIDTKRLRQRLLEGQLDLD